MTPYMCHVYSYTVSSITGDTTSTYNQFDCIVWSYAEKDAVACTCLHIINYITM